MAIANMNINIDTRPCIVSLGRRDKKKCEGSFHGIYQYSYTHGDSSVKGGYKAGTVAHPIAVVEIDGQMQEVRVNQVEFLDVVKRETPVEVGDSNEN
ncbi:hypothetical protein [Lactococcus petauri]|uniref:hypothetical protein n=1 Tax=Lactococcus petauri TaxID=1940789 RepID=UPI00254B72D8|nr:hypothetical protein [Lactococcus petauri]